MPQTSIVLLVPLSSCQALTSENLFTLPPPPHPPHPPPLFFCFSARPFCGSYKHFSGKGGGRLEVEEGCFLTVTQFMLVFPVKLHLPLTFIYMLFTSHWTECSPCLCQWWSNMVSDVVRVLLNETLSCCGSGSVMIWIKVKISFLT